MTCRAKDYRHARAAMLRVGWSALTDDERETLEQGQCLCLDCRARTANVAAAAGLQARTEEIEAAKLELRRFQCAAQRGGDCWGCYACLSSAERAS